MILQNLEDDDKRKALYSGECSCLIPCSNVVNLLIVGQSGTGKTTLVDGFVNRVLSIELNDGFRYRPVDERKLVDERTSIDGSLKDK